MSRETLNYEPVPPAAYRHKRTVQRVLLVGYIVIILGAAAFVCLLPLLH